jgi:hypothetical protein
MPRGNKNLPAVRNGRAPLARWYRERTPALMAKQVSMLQAMTELHYVSLAHLMKQMTAPSTGKRGVSDAVKTQIALAMSPRLNAEFKGRLSDSDRARPKVAGEQSDVLDAYRVRIKAGA